MIINCHLVSGRRREQQRNEQIAKIFELAFEKNLRNRGMTVDTHSQVILMGDLNYRINALNRDQVCEKVKQNKCEDLLKEDDLIMAFDKFNINKKSLDCRFQDMLFRQF